MHLFSTLAMEFDPTYATVHNEGCDLYYWHQGSGPLIIFIPGGNGIGRQYNGMIAALSDRYTCATFDRRQMSASKVKVNKRLNVPQQGRDALAVMKALGFEKSVFFGSSGGGVIAFQLAIDHPEAVEHVICHEAPTTMLLRNASQVFEWTLELLEIRDSQGIEAAGEKFAECFVNYPVVEGVPPTSVVEPENPVNFWQNEAFIFSTFTPDLRRLVENKTSVGVMRGVRSEDAWYAQTTFEQVKILGCPHFEVPGHHQGFDCETGAFAPRFLEMLHVLQEKKKERS